MSRDFEPWNNDGMRAAHSAPSSTHGFWQRKDRRHHAVRRVLLWIAVLGVAVLVSWGIVHGL